MSLQSLVREKNPDIQTGKTCTSCGQAYGQIANHWHHNPSHRPVLTEREIEIITGCMMGDGSLKHRGSGNPCLVVKMKNKEYIYSLHFKLERISSCVSKQKGGYYTFRTVAHPKLKDFDWYENGEKIYPNDIQITDTVLKHWYAQDGYLDWRNKANNARARISCDNEEDRMKNIESAFSDTGLSPSCSKGGGVTFGLEDTRSMLVRTHPPARGYAYKWENQNREYYEMMR